MFIVDDSTDASKDNAFLARTCRASGKDSNCFQIIALESSVISPKIIQEIFEKQSLQNL